jgi:hypothetical protein
MRKEKIKRFIGWAVLFGGMVATAFIPTSGRVMVGGAFLMILAMVYLIYKEF